jgi:hypothetical protein
MSSCLFAWTLTQYPSFQVEPVRWSRRQDAPGVWMTCGPALVLPEEVRMPPPRKTRSRRAAWGPARTVS